MWMLNVSAKWTLCECTMSTSLTVSANGAERGEHKWTHGNYTVDSLWAHFEHKEKLKRRTFYGLLRWFGNFTDNRIIIKYVSNISDTM